MMEKLITSFEGLIRRSVAPSVTFFVLALLSDLIRVECTGGSGEARIQGYVALLGQQSSPSPAVFTTLAVLIIIGFSYGLLAAQQLFFDNLLKKDFDPRFKLGKSLTSEAKALMELREKVRERLQKDPDLEGLKSLGETSDYVLYEIVGGIDPTDTRGFVDSAKAMGIVFVSLFFILLGNAVFYRHQLGPWTVLLIGLAGVCVLCGRAATKAQYRARALRLYVNFLAMPPERLRRRLLRPAEDKPPPAEDKADAKKKEP